MIKVENNGGKGNPYHNDATGEFASPSGASSIKPNQVFSKKSNFSSNAANEIKHSQPLSIEERDNLNQLGLMDKYMQQSGKDKVLNDKQSVVNDNNALAAGNQNKFSLPGIGEILSSLPLDNFKTLMRFVLGRFNFMVFAPNGRRLNSKVFNTKQNTVPNKVSTDQVENAHKEIINTNNQLKENQQKLDELADLKEQRQKEFGKAKKMFENWWDKNWQKVFVDTQNRQHQLRIKHNEDVNNQQKLNKQMAERNKFLQRSGK